MKAELSNQVHVSHWILSCWLELFGIFQKQKYHMVGVHLSSSFPSPPRKIFVTSQNHSNMDQSSIDRQGFQRSTVTGNWVFYSQQAFCSKLLLYIPRYHVWSNYMCIVSLKWMAYTSRNQTSLPDHLNKARCCITVSVVYWLLLEKKNWLFTEST